MTDEKVSVTETEARKADAAPVPSKGLFARIPEPARDHVIGGLLGGAYVAWLLATARSLGFGRDEGFYFHAAQSYAKWFELLTSKPAQAFQQATIDGIWGENHEHPALMKSLFGISWNLFYRKFHLFQDQSTAFRFPGMLMAGFALYLTYLFGTRAFSRTAGVVGAVLLAAMPRVFFHAHIACFDIGVMTMWLASVYVYWRAMKEGGLKWALLAGITYGLTLETKHNAWILPAVVIPHALYVQGGELLQGIKKGKFFLPAPILAMATIGPLVFYALWPWLWSDTSARFQEYVNFHVNHVYYNIEFFGKNVFEPPAPALYMPVMVLATVPTTTLLLSLLGMAERLRADLPTWVRNVIGWARGSAASPTAGETASVERTSAKDDGGTSLLLFLAAAAPLAVFLLPRTPIFGGTKHWFPAYPFLAIFAGRGFELALSALASLREDVARRRKLPAWLSEEKLALVLGAVVFAAPLAITAHSHPFGLSSYVPLVGGTAGGATLGLNRQFWGYTTQNVAPILEKAPPGASLFIHDTAWESWERMRDEKRVPQNLAAVGSPGDAMITLVQHELHMNEVDHQIWVAHGNPTPNRVLTHDGVPIVSVYTARGVDLK